MAKRKSSEVSAGSMADIAFLLLVFFLVTTTMDTDTGLQRKLPPIEEEIDESPPIKDRNVFIVLINSKDELLVENSPMDISELRESAKEFILNDADKATLPAKEMKYIEGLDREEYVCKMAVVSLQNDLNSTYSVYMKVQNELVAAYNECRNEFARREWGKGYDELTEDQQKAVREVIPQKLSEAEPVNAKL